MASGMEIQCRGLATRFLVDDDLGWHCLRLNFFFNNVRDALGKQYLKLRTVML